jgi:hypothetical protein
MLDMVTNLFAAGLLSGCAPIGFDTCNVRPGPAV